MELNSQLKEFGKQVTAKTEYIENEEGTKTSLILPFFNMLGYDTANPKEVRPEFTADVGVKKEEKVDYAIFIEETPILIIECKKWNEELTDKHQSQLSRYFAFTKTRFALLTNGIRYQFFSDLDDKNKMDAKPFLDFDITKLQDITIKEIAKFQKSQFDESLIINNASTLKYTKEIKDIIAKEMESPSEDFIKLLVSQVYGKRVTSKVKEEFEDIISTALKQIINEKVQNRLEVALGNEKETEESEAISQPESKIITTDEELEAYQIILAILRRKIPKQKIVYRDTQSYFGVLFGDNNRKPICRLHLNGETKYISLFDKTKTETKEKISVIDDIYKYEKELLEIAEFYLKE